MEKEIAEIDALTGGYPQFKTLEEKCDFAQTMAKQSRDMVLCQYSQYRELTHRIETLERTVPGPFAEESVSISKSSFCDKNLEGIFNELADQWKRETANISSPDQMVLCPAYLQIIGLGKDVIPFILKDLQQEYSFWFPALKALTRLNPVNESMRGDLKAIQNAWLDWGSKHVRD